MDMVRQLEGNPRLTVRRGGSPDLAGKAIVYWMRRSLRAVDNPALEVATAAGNALHKPVLVFFGLLPVPSANLRHYTLMVQAFAEIQEDLARKNILFIFRRFPNHSIVKFCNEVGAAVLITDENPLRGPEHRLQRVLSRLRIPVWSVDADVVVPSNLIPQRQYAARVIRPKLLQLRDGFLVKQPSHRAKATWRGRIESLGCDQSCLNLLKINRSVQAVGSLRGGTREALTALRHFVAHKLQGYSEWRNHPEADGTSRLSPYLHFGMISPITVAQQVLKASAPESAKEAFLDQLITWRELSINFVRHSPSYDSIECAEPWAQRTLAEHARDRRPVIYNERQLENAETHDLLWNAAQMQMVEGGWMHNYMRMYWAKKILEWTRSPAEAFQIAVRLNDKYQIDGRDPNGYAGIAWAIAGKFDRPWPERPIFGKVRSMSGARTGKKFDSRKYIAQHEQR